MTKFGNWSAVLLFIVGMLYFWKQIKTESIQRLVYRLILIGIVPIVGVLGFSGRAMAQSTIISRIGRTVKLKSPDGKFDAIGKETELQIIEVKTKRVIASFQLKSAITYNTGCSWSPDSTKVLIDTDSGIHVFDVSKKKQVKLLRLFPPINSCSWSTNGKLFGALGCKLKPAKWPDCLKIWDMESGDEIYSLERSFGRRLVWSNNSKKVAVIDTDWNVLVVDLESKSIKAKIKAVPRGYPFLCWSPADRYLAVAELAGKIEIYDTTDSSFVNSFQSKEIFKLRWLKKGDQIEITHDWNGKVKSKLDLPISKKTGEIERKEKVVLKVGMKGYIPRNLEECFKQLEVELSPKVLKKIQDSTEKDMIMYHHGLGTWLRNYWGLWSGSRLAKYFNEMKLHHPDDMSGVILKSYWRYKHSVPLELDKQTKYYRDYWERMKYAREKETKRVKDSKQKIQKKMLNLKEIDKEFQTITLGQRKNSGIDVRDVALFENNLFITTKIHHQKDDFSLRCYLLDPGKQVVKHFRVNGMTRVDGAVVWRKKLYILGQKDSKVVLTEIYNNKKREFAIPESNSWSVLGHGDSKLLLVQPRIVYEFKENGTWSKLFTSEVNLPKCARAPVLAENRLYFRDEGRHGDNKALSWINIDKPKYLVSFTKDTRMVGPSGPRWENVFSFNPVSADCIWLTAGSSSPSVIRWTKENGYEIAVMNTKLKFSGNLIGASYMSDPPMNCFSITCVNPVSKNEVLCAGPSGMFIINQDSILTLVRFRMTTQSIKESYGDLHWNWEPNQLVQLGSHKYFIGGHWGGCYLLDLKEGNWSMKSVDEEVKGLVEF